MLIIGLIATREEAIEIEYIARIDSISQRFQNLRG